MKTNNKTRLKGRNKIANPTPSVCPICGAGLELIDESHTRCSFCGSEILIDEATRTDYYNNMDSEGTEQTAKKSLLVLLMKRIILCVVVLVLFDLAFDIITGEKKLTTSTSEKVANSSVEYALEQIFGKELALISQEELDSIKYIEESIDASNGQFVITYSFENYDDYADFDAYKETLQECRVDSRNVQWTNDYTMLTGLQGFSNFEEIFDMFEFAPGIKLNLYRGDEAVSEISNKIDVSEIRELILTDSGSSLAGLEDFISLKNLQIYSFYDSLKDIDALASCSQLEKLTIEGGEELIDFTSLSQLKQVKELSLDCINLESIDFIQEMPQITKLKIDTGEEIDFSPISGATEITELSLYRLNDLNLLSDLEKLESLNLQIHSVYFGEEELDFGILATLPSLKRLHLYNESIIPVELNEGLELILNAKQIEELTVTSAECRLDKTMLEENHTLKYLNMSGTRFVNAQEGEEFSFIQNLKGLETLVLKDCDLKDISFVADLGELRSCNVETNFISDFSPFRKNLKLEELYCGNNTTSLVDLPENVKVHTKLTEEEE